MRLYKLSRIILKEYFLYNSVSSPQNIRLEIFHLKNNREEKLFVVVAICGIKLFENVQKPRKSYKTIYLLTLAQEIKRINNFKAKLLKILCVHFFHITWIDVKVFKERESGVLRYFVQSIRND